LNTLNEVHQDVFTKFFLDSHHFKNVFKGAMGTVKRSCDKCFEFRKSEARLSKEVKFHDIVDILLNR